MSIDESIRAAVDEAVDGAMELRLRRAVAEIKSHIDSRIGGSTVSVREAAEILDLCEDVIRARLVSGELKGTRPGARGHWRVYRSSLEGMTDVEIGERLDQVRAKGGGR